MRVRAVLRTLRIIGIGVSVYLRVIRPWQLRWGATDDELRRAMPGDEIVTCPTFNATRAVTVQAPPSMIWPWIVQIGFGKAGWYTYDCSTTSGGPAPGASSPSSSTSRPATSSRCTRGSEPPRGSG